MRSLAPGAGRPRAVCSCGEVAAPAEGVLQAGRQPRLVGQVGPGPADHLPPQLADPFLAPLLLQDRVLSGLAGFQELRSVLGLAVELSERAQLRPGHVTAGDEGPPGVADDVLQDRDRETPEPEPDTAD